MWTMAAAAQVEAPASSVQEARAIIASIASAGAAPFCGSMCASVTREQLIDVRRNIDDEMPVLLTLSFCRLTQLSPAVGRLTSLRELLLTNNLLTSLPDEICRLENLETLDLSFNSIGALPDRIGALRKLKHFQASCNQLTSLPESIRHLNALKTFDVSHNQLTSLPESIRDMSALESLDVSCNQLSALPLAIGQIDQDTKILVMQNLQTLRLNRNPLNRADVMRQCGRSYVLEVWM